MTPLNRSHIFAAGRAIGCIIDPVTDLVSIHNGITRATLITPDGVEPHESALTTEGGPIAMATIGPLHGQLSAQVKAVMTTQARELCDRLGIDTGPQRTFKATADDAPKLMLIALLTNTKSCAVIAGMIAKHGNLVIDPRPVRELWKPMLADLLPMVQSQHMFKTEAGCQSAFDFAWSLNLPSGFEDHIRPLSELIK